MVRSCRLVVLGVAALAMFGAAGCGLVASDYAIPDGVCKKLPYETLTSAFGTIAPGSAGVTGRSNKTTATCAVSFLSGVVNGVERPASLVKLDVFTFDSAEAAVAAFDRQGVTAGSVGEGVRLAGQVDKYQVSQLCNPASCKLLVQDRNAFLQVDLTSLGSPFSTAGPSPQPVLAEFAGQVLDLM